MLELPPAPLLAILLPSGALNPAGGLLVGVTGFVASIVSPPAPALSVCVSGCGPKVVVGTFVLVAGCIPVLDG
jgi:hypothetical protein